MDTEPGLHPFPGAPPVNQSRVLISQDGDTFLITMIHITPNISTLTIQYMKHGRPQVAQSGVIGRCRELAAALKQDLSGAVELAKQIIKINETGEPPPRDDGILAIVNGEPVTFNGFTSVMYPSNTGILKMDIFPIVRY